jgi:hypothetical protein
MIPDCGGGTGTDMTAEKRWLQEALKRARQSCNNEAYDHFLRCLYAKAERPGSKRSEKRTQRGCLTWDWKVEDLAGRSVLVVGENGIGDEILTIGCLPDLLSACSSVSWSGDLKLKYLFQRSFPEVQFVSADNPQPKSDGTIYSWELIGRFRKKLNEFSWVTQDGQFLPYLKHCEQEGRHMAARYRDGAKKIVGLAWRSERQGETLSDKSCNIKDVAQWAPFFDSFRDKVRFVSLQYGNTSDEISFAKWKYGVEIHQDQSIDIFNDVDAAAAQVSAMDYVVTISTTAAHIAGALGTPGWLMLYAKPFGHWRAGATISPWYPTLRPTRQAEAGEWTSVFQTVIAELDREIMMTGKGADVPCPSR